MQSIACSMTGHQSCSQSPVCLVAQLRAGNARHAVVALLGPGAEQVAYQLHGKQQRQSHNLEKDSHV